MISWENFKARRRLNVKAWLKNCNVDSHESLNKVLLSLGVAPVSQATSKSILSCLKEDKKIASHLKQPEQQEAILGDQASEEQAKIIVDSGSDDKKTKRSSKKKVLLED